MPILENKLVDELVKASLAVFESVFASKICDYQNKKITLKYFDDFDESILSCIRNTIKDQYELEKAQEFILQHPLYFKQNYQFIDDDLVISVCTILQSDADGLEVSFIDQIVFLNVAFFQ